MRATWSSPWILIALLAACGRGGPAETVSVDVEAEDGGDAGPDEDGGAPGGGGTEDGEAGDEGDEDSGGPGSDDGGGDDPDDEDGADGGDVDEPIISGIAVAATGQTRADVVWSTDEPTEGFVEYGSSADYDRVAYVTGGAGTRHRAELDGLSPGGLYYFRVVGVDVAGNVGRSPEQTFEHAPDPPADDVVPQLSDVGVEAGATTAFVTWTTDEPARSLAEFGVSPALDQTASGPDALLVEHAIDLAGLTPATEYRLRAVSIDAAGNVGSAAEVSFVTSKPDASEVRRRAIGTQWQPLELDFAGPPAAETDVSPNPFLDYRFILDLEGPSGQRLLVPGFFDGDGEGGPSGDVWRVRFCPDEAGTWSYRTRFEAGSAAALSLKHHVGTPTEFDDIRGTFEIDPLDPDAPGFYRFGALEYVGEHYLKFRDGPYFLKGGTNSPENFLGFAGFDNTFDQPGGSPTQGLPDGLHRFATHIADFGANGLGSELDPDFVSADSGVSSHALVGALNYLASRGVNSIYFMPLNLGGAGRETYPYVGAVDNVFDKSHFDLSKLRQWNEVFCHAQRKSILLHVTLSEYDNNDYLDDGTLGPERKLFLREMIARFAHAPAIKWNLSEESGFSQTTLEETAKFIRALDPYHRPIAFHTLPLTGAGDYPQYTAVLGDERFHATSLQCKPKDHGRHVETWLEASAAAGHRWVIDVDEQVPWTVGLTDSNAEEMRKEALWDTYFSGAAGIEWYAGRHPLPVGGDMNLEDFRTREEMWDYMRHAREFLEENTPFWEMAPHDELVTGESGDFGGAEVFAKPGDIYAIYYPNACDTGIIDLSAWDDDFTLRWYDPREGVFSGVAELLSGGGVLPVGQAPGPAGDCADWVALIQRVQ